MAEPVQYHILKREKCPSHSSALQGKGVRFFPPISAPSLSCAINRNFYYVELLHAKRKFNMPLIDGSREWNTIAPSLNTNGRILSWIPVHPHIAPNKTDIIFSFA